MADNLRVIDTLRGFDPSMAENLRGFDADLAVIDEYVSFGPKLADDFVKEHPHKDYAVCSRAPTGKLYATKPVLSITEAVYSVRHAQQIGRCSEAFIVRGESPCEDHLAGKQVTDVVKLRYQAHWTERYSVGGFPKQL
jgi:hypothetical protein